MQHRRLFVVVLTLFAILLFLQQMFDLATPPHQYRDARTIAAKPSEALTGAVEVPLVDQRGGTATPFRVLVAANSAPDYALRGVVFSSEGRPIANAVVAVQWPAEPAFPGDRPNRIALASTDAGGTYRISADLPRETFKVLVEADGFSSDSVLANRGQELIHRLAADGQLVVTATLRSSGQPVPCHIQVVRIIEPRTRVDCGWFVADGRGTATIRGLSAGSYQVVAHSRDADLLVINGVTIVAGEEQRLAVELQATGVRVSGTITDGETGMPIDQASLCLNLSFVGMSARSDAYGAFDMGIFPVGAAIQVYARAPGYALGQAFLEVAAEPRPLKLEMLRGFAVYGVIRSSAGEPVAGAQVWAKGEVTRGRKRTMHIARDAATAVSDGDGSYRLEHLVPEDMRYELFIRSHRAAVVNEALDGPLTADLRRDWVLEAGHTLRVQVQAGSGPAAGMRIIAFRSEPELQSDAMVEATTDASGVALLDGLAAGNYRIRPFPQDGWVGTVVVTVPVSGDVGLRAHKGDSVAGEVRRESGGPVEACMVAVRNGAGQLLLSSRFAGANFIFEGLEGAPYEVVAWDRSPEATAFGGRLENAFGSGLVVTIPNVGPMEGNVLRLPQRTPVANVKIEARAAGMKRVISTCTTDNAGNFAMTLPDNMLYDLYVVGATETVLARNRQLRIKQTLLIQ